jgi:hypothetical protein
MLITFDTAKGVQTLHQPGLDMRRTGELPMISSITVRGRVSLRSADEREQ